MMTSDQFADAITTLCTEGGRDEAAEEALVQHDYDQRSEILRLREALQKIPDDSPGRPACVRIFNEATGSGYADPSEMLPFALASMLPRLRATRDEGVTTIGAVYLLDELITLAEAADRRIP